jgi:hypothetical protein
MEKIFPTLCLSVIFNISLMGQEKSAKDIPQEIIDCLVEMGKDTIPILNICESKFLNFCFQKERSIFDFCGKKIAFFTGNTGTIKSTKKDFFDEEKYFICQNRFLPSGSNQLIIFNEDETKQVGYNAVIVSSSKKYITNEEIIRRLKNQR